MLEKEGAMPPDKKLDFISIVTLNFLHFEPAMMALDKGFNVVIEKPIAFSLEEAQKLKLKVEETGLTFAYSYLYRLSNGETGKTDAERWAAWKNQKAVC